MRSLAANLAWNAPRGGDRNQDRGGDRGDRGGGGGGHVNRGGNIICLLAGDEQMPMPRLANKAEWPCAPYCLFGVKKYCFCIFIIYFASGV